MTSYIIVNDRYSNDSEQFTFEELQAANKEIGWETELTETYRNGADVVVDSNNKVVAVEVGHEKESW